MKNILMTASILAFILGAWDAASAKEADPAVPAEKPAVQSPAPEPAKPEPKAEAPAPKEEAKAEAPAKAEPTPEAPAPKPELKPEPKPASKPEVKAEPTAKVEAPVKIEPKPEPAPKPVEPAKELSSCAKAFVPLAENYQKAHDELQKWIVEIDAKTAAASAAVSATQEKIEKNEAAITKLKIEGSRDSADKGRELAKDTKQLWADLTLARKERAALCEGFAREAIQRAKRYQVEIIGKLEAIKAQTGK